MAERLIINTLREAYCLQELEDDTMTVAELIEYLQEFDGALPVILSFDNDYTYGKLSVDKFELRPEKGGTA